MSFDKTEIEDPWVEDGQILLDLVDEWKLKRQYKEWKEDGKPICQGDLIRMVEIGIATPVDVARWKLRNNVV